MSSFKVRQGTFFFQSFYLFLFQYNTQHIMPLEDVKLESVDDDGSKFPLDQVETLTLYSIGYF